jgi:PAS domain S-box-containing protein
MDLRRRIDWVVGGYAAVATLWILLTDSFLHVELSGFDRLETLLQIGKGLAFVAVTSTALYLLMLRVCRQIHSAELARQDSDERFGTVLDSIHDHAVLLLDARGRITRCGGGAGSVLGWPPREMIGRHCSAFYLEEDVTRGVVDHILREAAERGRFEQDLWHRREDGTRYWASLSISRLADESGAIAGFVTVTRDITARREAEDMRHAADERLRESERRIRMMMDSSVDGLITIDERGMIESFSGAAARIFGYPPEQVIGKNVNVLMPEPERSRHDGYLWRYLATGEKRIIGLGREVQGLRSDGTAFPMDLAITEISLGSGQRRFVGTVRDLTERKEIERQLQQAQKMEAVGQLTGGLAHDFNNLLSVTLGCAELLQDRLHEDEGARKLAGTIIEAGRRGADLTRRLLTFSRRQTLEPVEVDLGELVGGLAPLLSRTLGEDIEISMVLPDAAPKALADPAQLENALLNLAINARDAMPNGGRLTISVGETRLDEDYARHNPDAVPGSYVVVAVSDTGTGMTRDVLERAFDPFFTTKAPGRGSGLGLSMIYGFARQSDGHVKIYSELGTGTTVRLYLPPAVGDSAEQAGAMLERGPLPAGTERILVVEDDTLVRDFVCEQLTMLGYRVVAVKDGPSALAELDSARPVDVLFTDVVMPGGMNGRELAEAALTRRPDLKLLFTSGYTEDVIVLQGKLAPGSQLLNKPYGRAALARKLRAVVDGA